ncbi:intracellular coagulation inhibitor 2-like [Ixodes scapularis]|uniref:intracellular coagulation inhibitor 2-like n=1 Tax=Ixodes scapularis TaxID=6945 RepID=UPI001A9E59E9|nr:intracellular coagulation inhibitor 2-like [Ixodes scapularis]
MLAQKVLIVLFVLLAGDSECNAEDSDMKLARAQNRFALKLLKELCSEEPESNIFFSPTSISVALAMVYAAARGKSEAEISIALGHTAALLPSRESTLESYKKFLAEQQTDDNVSLMIANAVFVQKKLKVLKSYRKELVDIFAAMYRSVDVRGEKSAMESEVNEWVKNKTKDQISGFKLPAGTITALLNAIYFKGQWETPFDLKYSFSFPFYNKGSEVVMVETMSRDGTVLFTSEPGLKCEAIEHPYKGGRHSMIFVFPNEKNGLAELRQAITVESIEKILRNLKETVLMFQLPKFDLKTEYNLVPALKKLGVGSIFSDADLSGIPGGEGQVVTEVQHKAAIEINEEGTVAAAATAVRAGKNRTQSFVVNRPFLFYICEKATGRLLFLGEVHALPAIK